MIGGYFCLEQQLDSTQHFLESLCPPEGELAFLMSGRCAIYYVLEELKKTDHKQIAYVPAYTCETVLAAFEKAGYQMLFYEIDRSLTPRFDFAVLSQISVLSLCGYFGFCTYDRAFVKRCKSQGIIIIEDTTHSIFSSDGIDPLCDYIVGSLRKWIGVTAGGFAIKSNGRFMLPLQPADLKHLALRSACMREKERWSDVQEPEAKAGMIQATALFWKAEMLLRQTFDVNASDPQSVEQLKHIDMLNMRKKRRENYCYLLEHLLPTTVLQIIFPKLAEETVPSHFTIFINNPKHLQNYLTDCGISSSIYWPVPAQVPLIDYPEAAYIYQHVLSIPCDQRYGSTEMAYLCQCINAYTHSDKS